MIGLPLESELGNEKQLGGGGERAPGDRPAGDPDMRRKERRMGSGETGRTTERRKESSIDELLELERRIDDFDQGKTSPPALEAILAHRGSVRIPNPGSARLSAWMNEIEEQAAARGVTIRQDYACLGPWGYGWWHLG